MEPVTIERSGAVSVLRMSRPPANAIDLDFARAVAAGFDGAMTENPEALVVTGSGRFFSGGLDLKVVPAYSEAQQRQLICTINRMIQKLYACPIPVVCAVNGHAIAGGLVLALTADYRVGPAEGAMFGLTEARAGIPFPAGPMVVLRAELAPSDLRYATLLSRNFSAEEAVTRGCLDELRPADRVLERAVEVARDLAGMPRDAFARVKRQIRADAIAALERLNATESDPMLDGWVSPEAANASQTLLSSRK